MQGEKADHGPDGLVNSRWKLGIRDVMGAVAATAAGLAWTRAYVLDYVLPFLVTRGALPQRYQLVCVLAAVPLLTAWSVGLFLRQTLVFRFTFPRSALRPGTLACGAVSLALAVEAALALLVRTLSLRIPGWRSNYGLAQPSPFSYVIAWNMPEVGIAVAVAWLLLAWARLPGLTPTLGDRLGQAFGWAWIALFLVKTGYFYSLML
ncbi:MAG: hypothetical protein NVSMB9_36220 [Isosphaeraceae bacterium]